MQSKTNVLSGENVQYTYEALISRTGAFAVRRNRLASVQTTQTPTSQAPQWGDGYGFDGFGNLTDMTPIGTGLNFHTTFSATTNQENGATYDANGNQTWSGSTYDVDNRMKNSGGEFYGYAPDNKRILKSDPWGGGSAQQETHLFFHGLGGERLGEYRLNFTASATLSIDLVTGDTWFGSKLLQEGVWKTVQDSKGSVRWRLNTSTNATETTDYYPFGGEKGAATAQNREKFGTYFRDNESGLDYADQRYFNSVSGRFATPDPLIGSASPANPQSWNRYSFVLGEPINSSDPQGLCSVLIAGITTNPYTSDTETADQANEFANEIGAISAYPYAGGSIPGGVANIIAQGVGIPTGATYTALQAIALAAQTPGPISIYAFSGGAAAFTSAWNYLTPEVQARIQSVTYIDPGAANALQAGSGTVDVWHDFSDAANILVALFGPGALGTIPLGAQFHNTGDCGHDWSCVFNTYTDQLSQNGSACSIGAGGVFGAPSRTSSVPRSVPGPFAGLFWFYDEVPPTPWVRSSISYDLP